MHVFPSDAKTYPESQLQTGDAPTMVQIWLQPPLTDFSQGWAENKIN